MGEVRRKRLGRYLVGPPIGEGGMATVFVGRLVGPGGFSRTVAIKSLREGAGQESDSSNGGGGGTAELFDEARIASRVTHPNVVSVLDVIPEDGGPHLVMEYVHGVSLSVLLAKHRAPAPPDVAVAIVRDTLLGLDAAHETKGEHGEPLDIVHRDVTPRNILVGADGIARIADFGIAKAVGTTFRTTTGLRRGTVRYMSPEHVRGETLTRQADVFSAGIVLWEALTGRKLFEADNDAQILYAIMERRIDPPSRHVPDISPALDAVVMRALERVPSARYLTAGAMAAALERAQPPASTRAVSAWVEQAAGALLAARAIIVREVERETSSTTAAVTIPTEDAGADATTKLSATTTSTSGPTGRWSDRRVLFGAIAAMVLVLGAAGMTAVRSREIPPATSVAAPAPAGAGTSTSTSTSTIATATATATPTATATASEQVLEVLEPTTTKARARTRPVSSARAKPGCDPPYRVNADGITVFKPECL